MWSAVLAAAVLLPALPAAAAPDLIVHKLDLTPENPQLGHKVAVQAVIKNIGQDDVGDFLCIGGDIAVHFLLDGEVFAEQQLSCGLDVGDVDPEAATVTITTPGAHTFEVIVDPDNEIAESQETNNSAQVTVDSTEPSVEVTHTLPSIGGPGLNQVNVSVSVTNQSLGKIKDVFVFLEIAGKSGGLDMGNKQGADLSPEETDTWETQVDYGLDVTAGAYEPGDYQWRYQVFHGGLPPSPDAIPLTEEIFAPLEIVSTVDISDDNIVIPSVDPVVEGTGLVSTFTAHDVLIDNELYTVSLGFVEPVDFFEDSSWAIFSRVHALKVTDAEGAPVCDEEIRKQAAQAVLLWRDLVVEHPWYKGTYVALQEGYDWYYDEKHLKVVFYITQPFVIVKELLQDMISLGKGLTDWVKEESGLTTPEEGEIGEMTFKMSMIITKSFDTAGIATQAIVKLSPLLAGEPYLSGHVISERLLQAIDNGGEEMDLAIELMHDLIKEDSPDRYTKISQAVPLGVILGSIGSTLAEGVKTILWTAVKRGFTAYFISKLTAKTAWKIALGEGSATLMAGLTTAGIAKGLASFGLTLIIDVSIAYLTYVGTFVDNIRGPGGLIEAGQTVAQSIPWKHVLYTPEGAGGPLDADEVDNTFMAHAVMYEVYGFINSDLAMLKKLAFAKTQAESYLDESLQMFEVSKGQRTFAVALQTTSTLLASGPCDDLDIPDPTVAEPPVRHEPAPEDRAADTPPEDIEKSPWVKPRAVPAAGERGSHPPVRWLEHSDEPIGAPEPPPAPPGELVETSSCTAAPAGDSSAPWLLAGILLLLVATRSGFRLAREDRRCA
ncbi:MAG: hypothetical protein ACI9WU_002317 [Myxococcota bacterium]|jgi:hypothetical protein